MYFNYESYKIIKCIVKERIIKWEIEKLNNSQSFSLYYQNYLPVSINRWFVGDYTRTDSYVYFESLGNYRYRITNKAISYYFGSVKNTRFSFDSEKIIFDPLSGNIAYDSINVLKTNTVPNESW